jgi:hypothetical protein
MSVGSINSFLLHLKHLRRFLVEIRQSGLSLNLNKCVFAQPEVVYLGHVLGGGRHRPDQAKTAAIADMPIPETKTQLRRVLGLFGFYRAYIPHYADIARPLTELTRKNKPISLQWSQTEHQAFCLLKESLCEAPVLRVAMPGKPFRLYTDASAFCVGAQLAQIFDDDAVDDGRDSSSRAVGRGEYVAPPGEHPIAYASQKLTATQCAWSTVEREAYAIIWALNRFKDIIFGAHITVICDQNSLKYIADNAPKNSKLTRWALALQDWHLTVLYAKGKTQVAPDCLSRILW